MSFRLNAELRKKVNRQSLLENGFLVIPDLLNPEQLARMRESVEQMVGRRKAMSAQNRKGDEPPGGAWATSPQPRLKFDEDYNDDTVDTIGFCLREETLGVSSVLLDDSDVSATYMACICNPEYDHGPAKWHRDTSPPKAAPLGGMLQNYMDHGPAYLQWNIPLYDDNVLWVVPGSHRRINTHEEDRQLAEDPSVALPGSIPVELKAGDGAVYVHLMLHWGSNYSLTKRRTVHLGYRRFGGDAMSMVHWRHWEPSLIGDLPSGLRRGFEGFDRLYQQELDRFEVIFRAMIYKKEKAFLVALAQLHPATSGRMSTLSLLSKLAIKLKVHKDTQSGAVPWFNEGDMVNLGTRFSAEEADQLCDRFAELDRRLRSPTTQQISGFQGTDTEYEMNHLPEGFGVQEFVASWEDPAATNLGRL
jgi:ectoine hydroxylase-related dioxygenase (phytanoyl-CoA dioxygenase family)